MITIKDYKMPETVEEAYTLLTSTKKAMIYGGGMFIRMGSKNIPLAIDLTNAGLDFIRETEEHIEIGAMCTYGDVERSALIEEHFPALIKQSILDLVGMQFRNIVTVGGTVYGRFGFSDLITGLMGVDTEVKLHNGGFIPLDEFLENGSSTPDILEYVRIRKNMISGSYKAMRNSTADYAILTTSASKTDSGYRIAVGARPQRAILATGAMAHLNENGLTPESIAAAAKLASEELVFGSNKRGSADYRKNLCRTLVKRALTEVMDNEN